MKLPALTTLTEEYLTVHITGILLTMKHHFIQRTYLLQQEDKCGYSMVPPPYFGRDYKDRYPFFWDTMLHHWVFGANISRQQCGSRTSGTKYPVI
jgi:hypothetical protein